MANDATIKKLRKLEKVLLLVDIYLPYLFPGLSGRNESSSSSQTPSAQVE